MESANQIFTFARKKLPKALSLLPLFIILSLVAHVGALVLFQIAYPSSTTGIRRSAEVYFLKPTSPEAQKLAPWLEAADPALFSRFQTGSRTLFKLPPLEYVPSFDLLRPHIPTLAPKPLTLDEEIHLRASRAPQALPQPLLPAATKVEFSESLATRQFEAAADFSIVPGKETLDNPTFSVAVADDGRPLFALLEQSSGQTELDVKAREYLLRGRFAPAKETSDAPVWGRATFIWGRSATPSTP